MTPQKAAQFLALLAEYGNVTASCKEIGITRIAAYRLRNSNDAFREAWDQAKDLGVEALEDEAMRRGFRGIEEPLHHQGRLTGDVVQKYSDTLLMFLLNGGKPEKYKQRGAIEHTGKDGGPILVDATRSSIEEALVTAIAGRATDADPELLQ